MYENIKRCKYVLPCLLSLLIVLIVNSGTVLAANDVDVSLNVDKENVYDTNFTANIVVKFYNFDYYDDTVYLSYHICDSSDNDIQFENERVPLIIDDNGEASIKLDVSLEGLEKKYKSQDLYIKYDIVDESRAYWFLTYDDISFTGAKTLYQNNPTMKNITSLREQIVLHPIIFIVNLSLLVVTIYILTILRKSELFS